MTSPVAASNEEPTHWRASSPVVLVGGVPHAAKVPKNRPMRKAQVACGEYTRQRDRRKIVGISFLRGLGKGQARVKGGAVLDIIKSLMSTFSVPAAYYDEFRLEVELLAARFKRERLERVLPSRPLRDYRPRESIVDYLKSPEGFGPWVEAGELSRPLLREKAPRAYTALANWLRNPTHSLEEVGLDIPTKSKLVEGRQLDPDEVRRARQLVNAYDRTRRRQAALP
jgi:hypothetical protein